VTVLTGAELMKQAWMTADEYLMHAIACIDDRLGEGYAKSNPVLVAAFMQTAATDFATGMLDNGIDRLESSIVWTARAIEKRSL
jgi:hypothetical protein